MNPRLLDPNSAHAADFKVPKVSGEDTSYSISAWHRGEFDDTKETAGLETSWYRERKKEAFFHSTFGANTHE